MSWFDTFNSKQKTRWKRWKTSFQKEIVENADQHKPVLNKIMTNDVTCNLSRWNNGGNE